MEQALDVKVYGKASCGLCDAAKGKLRLMGISFKALEIGEFTQHHEGWREDGSVEVMACYQDIDTLPVITVNGRAMSYPEAMKLLKAVTPSIKPEAAPMLELAPVQQELVAVA